MTGVAECRFLQRDDDRRQIFAVVDNGERAVAFGPLALEEVDRERYIGPSGLVWRGLGDEALARDLAERSGEFHQLDEFYRVYGYPEEIIQWVEATDLRFGRDYEEVAEHFGLDLELLQNAASQEAIVQGRFDPEGNYLFYQAFGDNWATGDLAGNYSINPNNYRFTGVAVVPHWREAFVTGPFADNGKAMMLGQELVARSAAECRLYMDLHPCSCGAVEFDVNHHLETGPGGSLRAVYEGLCGRCGLPRRFAFTLDPATPPPAPAFGGPTPSRIICPGQFAMAADQAARSAVLDPHSLSERERARGRAALARAVAAQEEVLKFIPAGADAVPPEAFISAQGRTLLAAEPGRFRKARLEAVATAYRDALARYPSH